MLAALIAGEHDPRVLSDLARGSMRGKISVLTEALIGQDTDHHVFLLERMLRHVDGLSADIACLASKPLTAPRRRRPAEAAARLRTVVAEQFVLSGSRPPRCSGAHTSRCTYPRELGPADDEWQGHRHAAVELAGIARSSFRRWNAGISVAAWR